MDASRWWYVDAHGKEWGPWTNAKMQEWFRNGLFKVGKDLQVRLETWSKTEPVSKLFPGDVEPFSKPPKLPGPRPSMAPGLRKTLGAPAPSASSRGPAPPPGPPPAACCAPGAYVRGHSHPRPMQSPPPQHADSLGPDRYVGRIKSGSVSTFGFIDCPFLFGQHGRDIWINKDFFRRFQVGDDVSFSLKITRDGKLQGECLEFLPAPQMPPVFLHPSPHPALGPPPRTGERHRGVLKGANLDGYGFIFCDYVHAHFGLDTYVNKKWLRPEHEAGQEVEFTLFITKDGKPQANDLTVPGELPTLAEPSQFAKKQAKAAVTNPVKSRPRTEPTVPEHMRTTLLLRSIPKSLRIADIQQLLDEFGFSGIYDLVYVATNLHTLQSFGYATVNLVTHSDAVMAMETLQGYNGWDPDQGSPDIVMDVSWSDMQGLQRHIEHYRNSPLMKADVPADVRPALFRDGEQLDFASSIQSMKRPRPDGDIGNNTNPSGTTGAAAKRRKRRRGAKGKKGGAGQEAAQDAAPGAEQHCQSSGDELEEYGDELVDAVREQELLHEEGDEDGRLEEDGPLDDPAPEELEPN